MQLPPLKSVCLCYNRGKKCKPVFTQIGQQVIKLRPEELRLPARAWKVKLIGEGADDAGGVFDDTITEMCQVCLLHQYRCMYVNEIACSVGFFYYCKPCVLKTKFIGTCYRMFRFHLTGAHLIIL